MNADMKLNYQVVQRTPVFKNIAQLCVQFLNSDSFFCQKVDFLVRKFK